MGQLNKSLESLGTSSVDIFYLHMPDPNTRIEDTLSAVNELYQGAFFLLTTFTAH
jgi:aflatoxin B1 aldehyde reductase